MTNGVWQTGELIKNKKILKQFRKEHNHTQENLAEKLEVSRQTVSRNMQAQTSNAIHRERLTKNKETINFFIIYLSLLSTLIPIASIVSLYLVFKWKDKRSGQLYNLSFSFLGLVSLLNIVEVSFIFMYVLM